MDKLARRIRVWLDFFFVFLGQNVWIVQPLIPPLKCWNTDEETVGRNYKIVGKKILYT